MSAMARYDFGTTPQLDFDAACPQAEDRSFFGRNTYFARQSPKFSHYQRPNSQIRQLHRDQARRPGLTAPNTSASVVPPTSANLEKCRQRGADSTPLSSKAFWSESVRRACTSSCRRLTPPLPTAPALASMHVHRVQYGCAHQKVSSARPLHFYTTPHLCSRPSTGTSWREIDISTVITFKLILSASPLVPLSHPTQLHHHTRRLQHVSTRSRASIAAHLDQVVPSWKGSSGRMATSASSQSSSSLTHSFR